MSPNLSRPCLALLASAVLLHCESKPSPPTSEGASTAAQPAGSTSTQGSKSGPAAQAKAPAAETEPDGEEIPTEEDFQQEAETQITATSDLNGELDALEKEIGAASKE